MSLVVDVPIRNRDNTDECHCILKTKRPPLQAVLCFQITVSTCGPKQGRYVKRNLVWLEPLVC